MCDTNNATLSLAITQAFYWIIHIYIFYKYLERLIYKFGIILMTSIPISNLLTEHQYDEGQIVFFIMG